MDAPHDKPKHRGMQRQERQEILSRLANRIRQLRKKHGITQETLADQSGLNRVTMGQIEQCKRAATILTLQKIAMGFGITMSELLKGVDKD